MSFNSKLIELLKTNPALVDNEGELLIAAVQDKAWKLDHDLIKLLLSESEIKSKFFDEIEGHWIFNTNTFLEYITHKNFLDNSYTRFRNKIGLTIDGKYLSERGEVALAWAYKDCVLEGGQTKEEEKRKEIFFNEILAQDEINRLFDPKVLTNFTRYTARGKEKVTEIKRNENGVISENLIIKGNNLIALHSLKHQFRGQVKLIYIDPPYNTGNDSFGYNDGFNQSSWLTFMKNRLEIARDLLRLDGFIFISIDDNEHPYLRILCNEIFKKENFISDIIIQSNKGGRDYLKIAKSHEYLLCYQRSEDSDLKEIIKKDVVFDYKDELGGFNLRELRNRNPRFGQHNRPNLYYPFYINPLIKDKNSFCSVSLTRKKGYHIEVYPLNSLGNKSCWRWGQSKSVDNILDNPHDSNIIARQKQGGGWNIYEKHRKLTSKVKSIWDESYVRTEAGTKELRRILGNNKFPFPKPVGLIKKILMMSTEENDLILDFFAGSGTTAQAVLEQNREDGGGRNFILIEQLDYIETTTFDRVKNVLDEKTDFIAFELMKYCEVFVKQIQNAENNDELLKVFCILSKNSFLNWYINPQIPEDAVKDFEEIGSQENGLEKQKKLLIELLDKNQLYVNLSEIDDKQFNVSDDDKALNKAFYGEI